MLTTVHLACPSCQNPKRTLNTQNRVGQTPLGWVLKCAADGDLLDARTASRLTDKLLEAGALAVLPSFAEKVSDARAGTSCQKVIVHSVVGSNCYKCTAQPLSNTLPKSLLRKKERKSYAPRRAF